MVWRLEKHMLIEFNPCILLTRSVPPVKGLELVTRKLSNIQLSKKYMHLVIKQIRVIQEIHNTVIKFICGSNLLLVARVRFIEN
jgi:hypothetical protein